MGRRRKRKNKHKNKQQNRINNNLLAMPIDPGTYELSVPVQNPRPDRRTTTKWTGNDWWGSGTRFIIKEQLHTIGEQALKFYTIENANGNGHHHIKSYEIERWNALVKHLRPVAVDKRSDLRAFLYSMTANELEGIIEHLEVSGIISRANVISAYEDYSKTIEA